MMKKFVRQHQDFLLGFFAIVLVGVVVYSYVYAARAIASRINAAFGRQETSGDVLRFHLDEARELGITP